MLYMAALFMSAVLMRLLAQATIARVRRAGFELYFEGESRCYRVKRGDTRIITAVIRNRSDVDLRLSRIRALAAPGLNASFEYADIIVPMASEVRLTASVQFSRIGTFALHGLELRASPLLSAFEAPLLFVNPLQFLVRPNPMRARSLPVMSGRASRAGASDSASRRSGESTEWRELRAYQPGDALRKIAWRASARRNQLLVRDEELTQRQKIWILLDASLELWSGSPGEAPLDHAIDRVAGLIRRHMEKGDEVGLGVLSARILAWLPAAAGKVQMNQLLGGLLRATQHWDEDRAGSDATRTLAVVVDHLQRIEPDLAETRGSRSSGHVAEVADRVLQRLGFEVPPVFAQRPTDQRLRQYAAAMGLVPAPRLQPERAQTDRQLIKAIEQCLRDRASRVVLCTVEPSATLLDGIEALRRRIQQRRVRLSLLRINVSSGIGADQQPASRLIADAVRLRYTAEQLRNRQRLRRLGIAVEREPNSGTRIGKTP